MCTTSMGKLSIFVLLLILAFITNAQASCSRWGHSCWGGHGKRSGGGSSSLHEIERRIVEKNRMLNRDGGVSPSWMDHINSNPSPPDGDSPSSTFSFSDTLLDSNLDGSRGFHSIPPSSFSSSPRNGGKGRDKISMDDLERRGEDGDDMAMEDVSYDYTQNDASPISTSQIMSKQREKYQRDYDDPTSASSTSFEDKRGDLSTRKLPKNNLFLYKLIRIR